MRLWEKYRPKTLADVVGQPPVRMLQSIARKPEPMCIILDGPGGVGKTSAGLALAHDLGCFDKDTWPEENPPEFHFGWNSGLFRINGSDLTVDAARNLFNDRLRMRYGSKSGYKVLLVEELERLSPQCQGRLKEDLECLRSCATIVVATSNGYGSLSNPLLQRFKKFHFSAGPAFMAESQRRLEWIWAQECPGLPFPPCGSLWGIDAERQEFSLRDALSSMEDHVALFAPECVGGGV